MVYAIYARKSVYSDKSDSVKNQIKMCREYVTIKNSGDHCFREYQDEGFTGANTDRPGLQMMLEDIEDGFVDAVVIYQLDRLSRDVKDFSNIYSLFDEHNIVFISVKESVDTDTPIGRAMIMITMVFAQMERETIANRVVDNMNGLAKKGFWPLGTVPTGYTRKHITVAGKRHSTLEIEPEGAEYIRGIYADFLSSDKSVRAMATKYQREGKLTMNGCYLPPPTLYRILTTPFYCSATPEAYDYWQSQGCRMDPDSPREMWDGKRAVMVYGRRRHRNGNHKLTPKEEWIVCLGLHEPLIPADQWLAVQEEFKKNTISKEMKYYVPLLKGVLKCARCGWSMVVTRKKLKNSVLSEYACLKRGQQGASGCDMSAVKCSVMDNKVLEILRRIEADPSVVHEYAAKDASEHELPDTAALERKISSQTAKIDRLAASLALAEESTASKYIVAEIERQDLNLQALKRELEIAKSACRKAAARARTLEERAKEIGNLVRNFDSLSDRERNAVVKEIVKECTWDGETLFLRL